MRAPAEIYLDALYFSETEGNKASVPVAKEWARRNGMIDAEVERLHNNLMYLLYGKVQK